LIWAVSFGSFSQTGVCHGCDHIAFIYHHLEAGTFNKDVLDAWLRGVVAAG